ncbi:monooxygenase, partial [Streptomyces sp. SID9124]|nr:monooxygenase [Streptomyces sp. SID9124]
RTVLHAALHRRALELGVRIVAGKVAGVRQDADRVTACGLSARWLIAADGLHSPLRRELGLDAPPAPVRRYGLRRHFRVDPWTDFVEVHWSRHGEAYVTPLGDGTVGVAVLGRERLPYGRHLAAFPRLAEVLTGREAGPVRGAGP